MEEGNVTTFNAARVSQMVVSFTYPLVVVKMLDTFILMLKSCELCHPQGGKLGKKQMRNETSSSCI